MRMVIAVLFALTVCIILSTPFSARADSVNLYASEAQDDSLVVPGDRVGWIRLGMKLDEVTRRLGNDYKPAGSNSSDLFFPKYQLTVSLSGDTVQGVGVMSSGYHTEKGLGVGSSEAEVRSSYGDPGSSSSPQGGACSIVRYDSRGITFIISRDGRVVSFCIFR